MEMNQLQAGTAEESKIDSIPEHWEDGKLFNDTLKRFLKDEEFILKHDLNERTITHKLAEYLNSAFEKYDVDCEYNRMHKQTIEGKDTYIEKILNLKISGTDLEKETSVFPDIIVHDRINGEDNYLIIEVKKFNYAKQIKEKNESFEETYREFDKRKIRTYINDLNYKLGIYMEFNGAELCELRFYQ